MSYRTEQNPLTGTTDYVIDGTQFGISSSPYSATMMTPVGSVQQTGLSDIRNMNIVSIPGEASVQFSTTKTSFGSFTGSVSSADASTDTISFGGATGTPVAGMTLVFAGGSLPSGITAGTQSASGDTNVYWIFNVGGSTFKIADSFAHFLSGTAVDITSDGTGTFTSIDMNQPRHSAADNSISASSIAPVYYIVDRNGRVWRLLGTGVWAFTGNITRGANPTTSANGNGLIYYRGYIFAMRQAAMDYFKISTSVWTTGWIPSSGSSNGVAFYTASVANSHHALVGQDDTVYICDSHYIVSFFEKPSQTFDPTNTATYTWAGTGGSNGWALQLPVTEIAQWLAELGTNLMVIGRYNFIYPWNRVATSFTYPIFLSEDAGYADLSVEFPIYPKMVTVNTNTFIFSGNRGRIFYTNGTNATLYAKVPDHLSGTVEPYFYWGGVGFNKNQLYFGVYATTNGNSALTAYGGMWALDLDTKALRLTNILSYNTYAGYMTLYIANPLAGSGSSFNCGWDSGASTYGMDASSGTPYTNYEPYMDSDLIPVGLNQTPYTPSQVEFKLTTPLVSGEGVKISYRINITDAFTLISETLTVGALSDVYPTNFQNAQWVQLRVNTKSTASSPSYTRLREIRIRNGT